MWLGLLGGVAAHVARWCFGWGEMGEWVEWGVSGLSWVWRGEMGEMGERVSEMDDVWRVERG